MPELKFLFAYYNYKGIVNPTSHFHCNKLHVAVRRIAAAQTDNFIELFE